MIFALSGISDSARAASKWSMGPLQPLLLLLSFSALSRKMKASCTHQRSFFVDLLSALGCVPVPQLFVSRVSILAHHWLLQLPRLQFFEIWVQALALGQAAALAFLCPVSLAILLVILLIHLANLVLLCLQFGNQLSIQIVIFVAILTSHPRVDVRRSVSGIVAAASITGDELQQRRGSCIAARRHLFSFITLATLPLTINPV
mmetsp:Transcript_28389/g.50742  ORF Transcript_28389/g.50742 Transcript_28389/m.50742 type:complete len:203 (+) Transcript_28389:1857-2465(+)